MRNSRFIGKFATIVTLFVFVVNATVFVHEVVASVYVKTETWTGTEYSADGFDWWIIEIPVLLAFAEASAFPTASGEGSTPGPYSGYASASATVGSVTERESGSIWIRIAQNGRVESTSGGYSVKVTGHQDASTSAFASGYLYGI